MYLLLKNNIIRGMLSFTVPERHACQKERSTNQKLINKGWLFIPHLETIEVT